MAGTASPREREAPVVLLVGGASGTGKSAIASAVAARLGIGVTSTDTVRQVMRATLSPMLAPALHASSFDVPAAGAVLPAMPAGRGGAPDGAPDPLLLGFVEQARLVATGVQALVERAEREASSLVLEGVHLVPGLVQHVAATPCAVVEVVVHVDDEQQHRAHFASRAAVAGGARAGDHFLRNLPRIRRVQRYLLAQAQRHDAAAVHNQRLDAAVDELVALVQVARSRGPAR